MNNIMNWLSMVIDIRQEKKVKHLMKDIIAIVFFASLANAVDENGFGLTKERLGRVNDVRHDKKHYYQK